MHLRKYGLVFIPFQIKYSEILKLLGGLEQVHIQVLKHSDDEYRNYCFFYTFSVAWYFENKMVSRHSSRGSRHWFFMTLVR
jgi:hypothetical protein